MESEAKLTVRLEKELHRKFRTMLSSNGDTAQAVITQFVADYIEAPQKKLRRVGKASV